MFGNVLGYVLFYIYKAPDYARIPPPFMRGSAPGYARTKSETPPDMRGPAPEYAKPTRNPKLTAGPFSGVRTRLCVVVNGGHPACEERQGAPDYAWPKVKGRPRICMGTVIATAPEYASPSAGNAPDYAWEARTKSLKR